MEEIREKALALISGRGGLVGRNVVVIGDAAVRFGSDDDRRG